jgi:predicted secreted protein
MSLRGALVAACAALVAGCASHLPQSPTLVRAGDAGRTVTLYQGDTLVVAMPPASAKDGRWQPATAGDAVLQQVGMADLLPPEVAPGTTGGPGETVYRYRAARVGTTTLAFDDAGAVPPRTLRYDVAVLARPGEYAEAWAKPR